MLATDINYSALMPLEFLDSKSACSDTVTLESKEALAPGVYVALVEIDWKNPHSVPRKYVFSTYSSSSQVVLSLKGA